MQRAEPDVEGLAVLGSLRRLLEHRVRLAICVLLAEHDAMSFSRLKQVLEETDGSLGTHLRKLEDEGYLTIEKTFRDRRPVTWYQLTDAGRTHLKQHVKALTKLIRAIQKS
ncbi:MAG: helix-turn-helix domain-containing protein [Gammaproteobacteria bacterium]|nr:helix-turn-helix domain-containing protein [Gammaproteobacteria bacterium]